MIDYREIENRVEALFKEVDYTDLDNEIDVISIAKRLGFAVGNAVMIDDTDGFIIVKEGSEEILGIKTDKLIGVNLEREPVWKRFIIAHELAHFKLHYSKEGKDGLYAHRDHIKGKNDMENEADYFAACLLLPREAFTKNYLSLKEKELDLEQIVLLLADKFKATRVTVQRRIGELGLNE